MTENTTKKITHKGEYVMDADQMAIIFHLHGELTTARGIVNYKDYGNIKQAFIVSAKTPLYRISDYWGYGKIWETWEELLPWNLALTPSVTQWSPIPFLIIIVRLGVRTKLERPAKNDSNRV